ncbi:isoprenylcysteine carboxylmethyltransferase family protein [Pseudaminobacter arsenicus]|uniref:Isoprenylcysteine carboxylmethyltransferase family protein n=1 Tax=Borborobacter arsenicus TaxID=1851146 RepID=A0A432V9F0_9HYPH|nr:isoprenylcysteine carboxylmethyltransferase family protein [Pseudaminobacter arsenicus]RUM98755.1 isoprenylcysteine carboxylmethyltransferase family protein [Pseudaminobacter arsenicus]
MTDIQATSSHIPWPPIIYLVAIVAAGALTRLYPLPWLQGPFADVLFAAGGLAVVAAIALYISAIGAMRRAATPIRPGSIPLHLVTSGAFGLTRNPIYLANTLVVVSIGLITGSLWFFLIALLAAFATQKLAIDPEESHLQARFGKKYRDYAKRVRRWI